MMRIRGAISTGPHGAAITAEQLEQAGIIPGQPIAVTVAAYATADHERDYEHTVFDSTDAFIAHLDAYMASLTPSQAARREH